MIKGNLSSFSLGEVFQSLSVNNHTGTLKIQENDGEEKFIYFSKGEICLFSSKSNANLRIGEILVRQGSIGQEELKRALEEQKETRERLGKVLVKSFGMKPDNLQRALETKICEEIYDLFLIEEADFEFLVDHFPEEIFDSTQKSLHISINTYSVLMEGMRLADEWKVIHKKIQSFKEIFIFQSEMDFDSARDSQETSLFELLDGQTPVYKLFDTFAGSRFDCCKTLFEFLGAGKIRPLNLEECRERGEQASKDNDLDRAIDFLQFAIQIAPDRPEPLVLIGELLKRSNREAEGHLSLLRATHLFFEDNQHSTAIETGEPLIRQFPKDQELLNTIFQSALITRQRKLVAKAGDALSGLLVSKGSVVHAAEILLKVVSHFPKDFKRRVHLAELLRDAGDLSRAIAQLEEIAEYLTGRHNVTEKVKVLRQIFEIDADRHDIKLKIENLLTLQENIEKQKKRRVSIAGVILIVLLLLGLVPFLYEVKARELLSHARRVEEISNHSGKFARAKAVYLEFLHSYEFSLKAPDARVALERIETEEQLKLEKERLEHKQREEFEQQQLQKVQEALTSRLQTARSHEQKGELKAAFDIYKSMMDEFPDVPQIASIQIPLLISTTPRGSAVEVDGVESGNSPVVIHRKRGAKPRIRTTRQGCAPMETVATVGERWRVHLDLNIVPLKEFKVSGPIHQPLDTSDGFLFFPSRDGFFYAVDPQNDEVRWKRKIGYYGDLTSDATRSGQDIVLGTVSGEVARFSRNNGKSRWRTFLDSSVLARPATSLDGKWLAVGDLSGRVTLLHTENGKPGRSYVTQNEILCPPLFWKSTLIVASEDNNIYFLSVPDMRPLHVEPLSRDVKQSMKIVEDSLFFISRDGVLHSFDLARKDENWSQTLETTVSNQFVMYRDSILVGTTAGMLNAYSVKSGKTLWKISVSKAGLGNILVEGQRAYFGTERGEIVSVDLNAREVEWTYESYVTLSEAPVRVKKELFFPSRAGNFRVMEVRK